MNMRRLLIVYIMYSLIATSSIYAERIELKNGQIIEGTIINKKGPIITVELDAGTIDFNMKEIKSISPSVSIKKKSDVINPPLSPKTTPNNISTQYKPTTPSTPKKKMAPLSKNHHEDVNLEKETDYFVDYLGGQEAFLIAFEKFKHIAKNKPDDFENHYKLGLSYFYLKQYEPAITELNTVLHHNPKDLEAQRFLGYAHYKTGNIPMAIEQFKKRLEGRPFDLDIRKLLASCYFQINDLKLAAQEYERILDYDPDNTLIILKLAKIYTELGITQRAQELKEKAQAIDPTLTIQ